MSIIGNRIEKTEQVNWHEFKFLQPDNFKELSKDAMEKLKESIIQNDFIESFKVWYARDTDIIYCLDGFHRCKAMRELEQEGHKIAEAFPANFLKCKNKEEAAKLVLIFSSIYAVTQQEGLKDFLEIYDLDLNVIKNEIDIPNINIENLELLLRNANIDEEKLDEVPEPQKEAVSQLGDIFLLDGRHRVMCGDSTKKEDVGRLMGGRKADMVFTDPPYNVDYSSKNELLNLYDKGNHIQTPIRNDNIIDAKEYQRFISDFFGAIKSHLSDYNAVYVCGNYESLIQFYKMDKLKCSNLLVWVKNAMVLGRMDYQNQHEFIFYGWYGKHKWFGDRKQTTVWNFNKPTKSELHPTMKPVELIVKAISNSTQSGNNLVLDVFLGSGSTLIASEQTGRICYGMEIDPIYIDVILRRYKNLYPDAKIECLNRNFDFNKLYNE